MRATQLEPNPPLRPEHVEILGVNVAVIPVADLVRMKLNSYRDIDRVHVRDMDSIGLVTPAIESALTPELRKRLDHIRATE